MPKWQTFPVHGGPWLKVKKSDDGAEVEQVKNDLGTSAESGPITDLKLKFKTQPSTQIIWFPDDAVIRTQNSPGCTWYFFQGRWWRVCDT